jgi:hypothetical protein
VLLLFCATAGEIFARRSRTTLLLAALNVCYPGVQQLGEKKQNHIIVSCSGCPLRLRLLQREKAKPHHCRLLFISCSRHVKQEVSEKKQNHMIILFAGMLLIAFSLFLHYTSPSTALKHPSLIAYFGVTEEAESHHLRLQGELVT